MLDRLGFSSDLRSLLGPAKGEGSVALDGESYLFSLATGRAAADGAVRVRLLVAAAAIQARRRTAIGKPVCLQNQAACVEAVAQAAHGVPRALGRQLTAQWLSIVPCHLRPLGQVRMARVDRAPRVAQG